MRASLVLAIALFAGPVLAQEESEAPPPPPIPPEGSESTAAQREAQREARAAQEEAEAEGEAQAGNGQRPQPLPPKVEGEAVEPEVTIRREADRTIEEYSVHGQVYMVKINPDNGPPYYLLDTDGDGEIDIHDDDRFQPVKPVQWKLFEWD